MERKALEEMATVANDLYKKAVKLNRQAVSYRSEMVAFVLECETDAGWLKGKIEELIVDRKAPTKPQPYTIGREL